MNVRSKFFVGLLSLFLFLSAVFVCDARKVEASKLPELTISEVLKITNEANPVIAAASRRIDQATARVLKALSSKYPQIDVSMVYQETEKEPLYPVYNALTGSKMPYYAQAGFRRTWKAALSMSYLLYSGGAVENNIEAQKLARKVAEAEFERTKQQVINEAKRAYYSLLSANDRCLVAQEALDLTKEHLRQVQAFYKHGVVPKNEVLRVQVAVSQAELDLIQAKSALDVAWLVLERVTGTPMRDKYSLPSVKTGLAVLSGYDIPGAPQDLAMKLRPEIRALENARASALHIAAAAAGKKRPQVMLTGEAYKVGDEFFPDDMDDWRVSLAAVWTLYDGEKTSAEVKEALASAEEVLYNLEDLKRAIILEVNAAMKKLEAAQKRIEVAKSQVEKAEEDYRMALKRYAAQVGTNIDVLDARVALINAKNNYSDAVYETQIAKADLDFAIGISGLQSNGN